MSDYKSRNYCLTLNNYSEADYLAYLNMECKYIIVGKEVGEQGTRHLQAFVMFENQRAFNSVKKMFPRAHIEQLISTPVQAMEYCKKEGMFEERGDPPTGAGKRTDLDLVKDKLKETGRMSDVVEVATSYQSVRMAECILKYKEKPRDFKPHVSWFWGPTGTGKSKKAYEEMGPEIYTCLSTGKWFEGYDAHENVLIDDMRKDFMKFHELLRLLDRYAMRVECKGGSRQFLAKRIIITSAFHPSTLFDTREDLQQLIRRIDVIEEFVPFDISNYE